jgi:thermostable 8-oxoguanine DNA glycosylase
MKTTISDKNVVTTISPASREKLLLLLRRLGPIANVPRLGRYRNMSGEEIWSQMVSDVCAMGSARGMESMGKDHQLKAEFAQATSLTAWEQRRFAQDYLAEVLKRFSATRFPRKAAEKLRLIVDAPTAVKRSRVVLLNDLPTSRDPNVIRDELIKRCPAFRLKSASVFMIALGLSHNVIALDTRVVGALQQHLAYNLKVGRVQGSKPIYLSVEAKLRDVCKQAGSSLATLDQTLFQFTSMSAVEYVMRAHGGI